MVFSAFYVPGFPLVSSKTKGKASALPLYIMVFAIPILSIDSPVRPGYLPAPELVRVKLTN